MKNTEKAFLWIIEILEENNIPFKISGGFAARAYGVNRELADIDIEVNDKDILLISDKVKTCITHGPYRYKDDNWDLELMTLQYEGQEIDITGIGARIFNKENGVWNNSSTDLNNYELIEIYGKKVPVEKIDSLIAYKTKLSREVDVEDIRQLKLIKG